MGRGTENGKGNLPMPSSVSGFCQKRERERERFSVLAQKRNGPSKLPALTYPLPPKRPNCGTVSDKSGMS